MMKTTYIISCFILVSSVSCKNEAKQAAEIAATYTGHWDLTYGELNEQPTPALDRIFFNFGTDASIQTNFTGSEQEESGTFKIKEDKLVQNTAETIEYQIVSKTDSTIEMTTELRGFDFKLVLKKANP